jgi:hypothetical protein
MKPATFIGKMVPLLRGLVEPKNGMLTANTIGKMVQLLYR